MLLPPAGRIRQWQAPKRSIPQAQKPFPRPMPIPDTSKSLTIEKLIELIDAVESPTRLLTSDGLIPLWVPFEDMTPEQQHACTRLEERVGVKMRDIRDYVNSRKPHGAAPDAPPVKP
jgi:hypothetical protein